MRTTRNVYISLNAGKKRFGHGLDRYRIEIEWNVDSNLQDVIPYVVD